MYALKITEIIPNNDFNEKNLVEILIINMVETKVSLRWNQSTR